MKDWVLLTCQPVFAEKPTLATSYHNTKALEIGKLVHLTADLITEHPNVCDVTGLNLVPKTRDSSIIR